MSIHDLRSATRCHDVFPNRPGPALTTRKGPIHTDLGSDLVPSPRCPLQAPCGVPGSLPGLTPHQAVAQQKPPPTGASGSAVAPQRDRGRVPSSTNVHVQGMRMTHPDSHYYFLIAHYRTCKNGKGRSLSGFAPIVFPCVRGEVPGNNSRSIFLTCSGHMRVGQVQLH